MKKSWKVVLLITLILCIDQAIKIWVKTHMVYGEEIRMLGLDWARIHFIENNGMAFGISLGGAYGKLTLSLFRLFAISFLVYLIHQFLVAKVKFGILFSFSLILAGAIGNILDSAFYGLLFSASYHGDVAQLFPPDGGYAGFLHGRVVDMFYFPIFDGYWPDWIPYLGGESLRFFRPVFNFADVAISVGVLNILLFQRNFFFEQLDPSHAEDETAQKATETTSASDDTAADSEEE